MERGRKRQAAKARAARNRSAAKAKSLLVARARKVGAEKVAKKGGRSDETCLCVCIYKTQKMFLVILSVF